MTGAFRAYPEPGTTTSGRELVERGAAVGEDVFRTGWRCLPCAALCPRRRGWPWPGRHPGATFVPEMRWRDARLIASLVAVKTFEELGSSASTHALTRRPVTACCSGSAAPLLERHVRVLLCLVLPYLSEHGAARVHPGTVVAFDVRQRPPAHWSARGGARRRSRASALSSAATGRLPARMSPWGGFWFSAR